MLMLVGSNMDQTWSGVFLPLAKLMLKLMVNGMRLRSTVRRGLLLSGAVDRAWGHEQVRKSSPDFLIFDLL